MCFLYKLFFLTRRRSKHYKKFNRWFSARIPKHGTRVKSLEKNLDDDTLQLEVLSSQPTKNDQTMSPCLTPSYFDNLPMEIIELILEHLSIQDQFNVRQLNTRCRHLSLSRITELAVEKNHHQLKSDFKPNPRWGIVFDGTTNQRRILELVLQQSGLSLKCLLLGELWIQTLDYEAECRRWTLFLVTIPAKCPNVVSLFMEYNDIVSIKVYMYLFQYYGRQLESAGFVYPAEYPQLSDFIVQQLNSDCLTALHVPLFSQSTLDRIVNQFPLLTKFSISPVQFELDLSSVVHKLVHLKELFFLSDLNRTNFRLLMQSPIAANLHTLEINLHEQEQSSMSNLKSLRRLIVSNWPDCQLLLTICKLLPNLKSLGLSYH